MSVRIGINDVDLVKAPHILIGGSTGSGKSYMIKSMICSILEDRSNDECKLIVIDPKSVDYQFLRGGKYKKFEGDMGDSRGKLADWYWSMYGLDLIDRDSIDSGYALRILSDVVSEMSSRYRYMKKYGYIDWKEVMDESDGIGESEYESIYGTNRIVLVIDELADLIYWDRDKSRGMMRGMVERYLVRMAMLGRAAGIHLILGTQRPDAQILSGQLRANISCRICLRVSNTIERRIVLGTSGNECGNSEREMVYRWSIFPIRIKLDKEA